MLFVCLSFFGFSLFYFVLFGGGGEVIVCFFCLVAGLFFIVLFCFFTDLQINSLWGWKQQRTRVEGESNFL